ncbi:unnamed protein product [Alopecurus aequalis]
MAGKEGKLVLGRCTAGQKAATRDETSTKPTLSDGERCTTEPMEVSREDAVLKRKAEEEIYPHPDQEQQQEQEKAKPILMAAILHKGPDVESAAAAGEATEPKAAEGGNKEAVSEHRAEVCIMEAVYEPQAEDLDGYEDEAEDDYEDDAEYDDDAEDDYDYDEDYEEGEYDYEPYFEEQRPKVRAVLQSFPEAADLTPLQLDDAVERVLEQSKPEYADVAATGKIRLLKEDIEMALDSWTAPPPSIIHNQASNDTRSADSIRRWEELDKEFLPLYGKVDEDRERFRAMVRKDLIEKGYVEVDEDYYDKKDEYERQMRQKLAEEWKQLDFSRFCIANNEDGICYYSEEQGGYI